MSNRSNSNRPAAHQALAITLAILFGGACAASPKRTPSPAGRAGEPTMPGKTIQLTGAWEKMTTSPCSRKYPARVEFQARGLYTGTTDPPGEFTWWDAGTWEAAAGAEVKLSTANDAVIAYKYSISGNVVTFSDPDGCEFKYRRAQ